MKQGIFIVALSAFLLLSTISPSFALENDAAISIYKKETSEVTHELYFFFVGKNTSINALYLDIDLHAYESCGAFKINEEAFPFVLENETKEFSAVVAIATHLILRNGMLIGQITCNVVHDTSEKVFLNEPSRAYIADGYGTEIPFARR